MTRKEEDLEGLLKFVFELGQLKRTPRSGWLKLGVDDPETVAEHSFRTAAIGFLLAEMGGYDSYRVAGYCLFHDVAETRTGDLDWLAQRYLDRGDYLASEALGDQLRRLPEGPRSSLEELFEEAEGEEELERVARDADLLDLAFQALEYGYHGNELSGDWFDSTIELLRTEPGKRIGRLLEERKRDGTLEKLLRWWKGLKLNESRGS